jgi:hypothetical protein
MALQMLAYGVKHNNMDMVNLAAKHTIKLPPNDVFKALASEGPEQFLKWVIFSLPPSTSQLSLICPPRSIFVMH